MYLRARHQGIPGLLGLQDKGENNHFAAFVPAVIDVEFAVGDAQGAGSKEELNGVAADIDFTDDRGGNRELKLDKRSHARPDSEEAGVDDQVSVRVQGV